MIQEVVKKFDGAVSLEWALIHASAGIFTSAFIRIDAAPTTSENLVITFMSRHGSDYDTEIYSVDPSIDGLTNIAYSPSVAIPMNKGDKIQVSYSNSDGNNIRITLKGLDSTNF